MVLLVLVVGIAMAVSFLCSLTEATVLSLTPTQIAQMSTDHPRRGLLWHQFKMHIERPISAILLLNTTANTVGAAVAGAQFARVYDSEWVWAFSLVFTYLILQFSELLPKTLGVRHNRAVALVAARPLELVTLALRPLLGLVHLVNRVFTPRQPARRGAVTLDEIAALAGLARLSQLIGAHEERIIRGAARLSSTPVLQVMIPVEQITFLSTSQGLKEALTAAHLDPHTRFPICENDDRDKVRGYINFKEMIYYSRTNPNDWSLLGVIRPVRFVKPEDSAGDLLRVFVEEHVHMAIVRDEQGRTLGLVTLEDVVEELVGEIEDEFDRPPRMFHALSGGTWMIGGGLLASDLVQRLGLNIPDAAGTVSTWLIRRMGRLPRPSDTYRLGDFDLVVRRVRRRQIFEVAAIRSKDAPLAPPTLWRPNPGGAESASPDAEKK